MKLDIWSTVQHMRYQVEILEETLADLTEYLESEDQGEDDDMPTVASAAQSPECGIRVHDHEGELP